MKRTLKLTLSTLLLVSLTLLLTVPSKPKTSTPFSLEAIASPNLDENNQTPTGKESREVIAALSQDYRYLGSGGQCYAFVSSDDQYVIKFFKQKAFVIPEWIQRFPVPILIQWLKEKKMLKRQERRNKVFTAFELSLDNIPEETGLLYVHFNQTAHLNKTLSLCDAIGKSHLLNLDKLEFVIQRKAMLTFEKIETLMGRKDSQGAKKTIDKLLDLNLALYRKGFRNRDPNFRSNCGFVGDKAILIDVGRIVYNKETKEPEKYRRDLMRGAAGLKKYLSTKYPELLSYFDNRIAKILQSDNDEDDEHST